MNRLNKWDFVDIQMAETSKLELAQEYADREMENLKAFAEERVLSGADDLAASGKDCESQTENGKNFV